MLLKVEDILEVEGHRKTERNERNTSLVENETILRKLASNE